MKGIVKLSVIVLASAFFLFAVNNSYADQKTDPNKADSKAVKASEPNAVEQKTCPVMGGAIDKKVYTVYKGKKVYFCCSGCKPKFEKNPEKYIDKLPQFKK